MARMRMGWPLVAALVVLSGCARDDCNTPGKPCFEQHRQAQRVRDQKAVETKALTRQECIPAQPFPVPPGTKEWTSASKLGDGSVFAFRGNRIGDPIERLFPCADWPDVKGWRVSDAPINRCNDATASGVRSCSDASAYVGDTVGSWLVIGNVRVTNLDYVYLNGRLVAFSAFMRDNVWPGMAQLLEAKYGQPSSIAKSVVENKFGAKFEAYTDIWNTPDGQLRLRQHYPSLDSAFLDFVNPGYEKLRDDAMRQRTKDAAKNGL